MSDRPRRLVLPPSPSTFPDLDQANATLQDLERQRQEVSQEIDALVMGRGDAERADIDDQANAIRAGGKDPGWKRRDKVDREVASSRDRITAISRALIQVEEEVIDLVESHREEWMQEGIAAAEAARTEYQAAIESALASNRALRESFALLRWIARFPDVKAYKVGDGLLALTAPSGDAYSVTPALMALMEEAQVIPTFAPDVTPGPPKAAPGPRTQEEAQALVEEQRRRRIEMGYELPPKKMAAGGTLPPSSVLGGRDITP